MPVIDPLKIIAGFYPDGPLRELLLKHSMQVRDKALKIMRLSGLRLDEDLVCCGAMLHDIGIFKCHAPSIFCNGSADYIAHGVIGAELLRTYAAEHGISLEGCARICERHTGSGLAREDIIRQGLPLPAQDFLPETPEEKLICLADKFFSKSGSMQEKPLSKIRLSMAKIGDASLARFDDMYKMFIH